MENDGRPHDHHKRKKKSSAGFVDSINDPRSCLRMKNPSTRPDINFNRGFHLRWELPNLRGGGRITWKDHEQRRSCQQWQFEQRHLLHLTSSYVVCMSESTSVDRAHLYIGKVASVWGLRAEDPALGRRMLQIPQSPHGIIRRWQLLSQPDLTCQTQMPIMHESPTRFWMNK